MAAALLSDAPAHHRSIPRAAMQGRGFQRRALRAAAAPVPAAPAPGASTAAEARAVAPASLPDRAAAPPAASWLQQPAPPHSASGGTARAKEARAVAPASSPDRASALPMVWLQQSAQPPSASDALPADSLAAFPTEYALVIGCVVAVTTASFTLVPPQVLLRVCARPCLAMYTVAFVPRADLVLPMLSCLGRLSRMYITSSAMLVALSLPLLSDCLGTTAAATLATLVMTGHDVVHRNGCDPEKCCSHTQRPSPGRCGCASGACSTTRGSQLAVRQHGSPAHVSRPAQEYASCALHACRRSMMAGLGQPTPVCACLRHGPSARRVWRTGARQEAGMQLAGGRGCCARACARAAARLQHAVLVRGPDQSYCLALQVADAPLPGSDDAWAPPAQAGPALRLGSGSAPAEQAAV